MSCPTCSHTLSGIDTSDPARRVYWCPRCGTLSIQYAGIQPDVAVPTLRDRVRTFAETWQNTDRVVSSLHHLGIFEAIYLPDERPDL
jgi:hypothetical protein